MFDTSFEMAPGVVVCMYDIDVRDVHDGEVARRILEDSRRRLELGRRAKPDAVHYVNVIGRPNPDGSGLPAIDEVVRVTLFPALDEIADSVSVQTR